MENITKKEKRPWTREESILVMNLYCKLPFGKLHRRTPAVIELSKIINRTPDAVAYKLGNFASFDPTLQARGIKGLSKTSKLDEEVWNEFYNNWDEALFQSEVLLATKKHISVVELNDLDVKDIPKEGLDKERIVKMRVNQSFFRKMVLATYENSCCITGMNVPELLVASHIVPWSKDKENRLNPSNGLCLNALHDKAFDAGLITITAEDFTIKISSKLKAKDDLGMMNLNFRNIEGRQIFIPKKFLPSKDLLKWHNDQFEG